MDNFATVPQHNNCKESPPAENAALERPRPDVLRRFTSTPYATDLRIMGKTMRLESNSAMVIDKALHFFARYRRGLPAKPEFVWRIISEHCNDGNSPNLEFAAFSDPGLRFANVGQRSFVAVDLRKREAIAFVDERTVESEPRLNCRPVFDTLFCMCAGALGLTALTSACVATGGKGVLIFGPANSGKTTSSYLAARRGFEFHADQATFLEMQSGELQAWGDLLPAIFRPESLQFLPELHTSTLRFSHPVTVHYLSKRCFQGIEALPIAPLCCLFLNRGDKFEPKISSMSSSRDLAERLFEAVLFRDDDQFQSETLQVTQRLAELPAYEVTFSDPAVAASYVQKLLTDNTA